jgi:hypothetical protein
VPKSWRTVALTGRTSAGARDCDQPDVELVDAVEHELRHQGGGNTVQVSKNVAGNTTDLKDNITVTIIGSRQADGSIKATTIQIGSPSGFSNQATSQ